MASSRLLTERKRRGQATVEFAMVAAIALLLIFAVIQGAVAVYAYSFVSYAARCGARYAMVHGSKSSSPATNASVQTYVRNLAIGLDPASIAVSTTWTPNNDPGSVVQVNVTYAFTPFAPFVWSSPLSLSSTAQNIITY